MAGDPDGRPGGKVRVLIVEDNELDAELLARELRRGGVDCECQRAQSEQGFLAALAADPDVILCDFSMPGFNATRALELHKSQRSEAPFIIVSGSVGEDVAVAAMQAGATDYLRKDRLDRLAQAVIRALDLRALRHEKRRADEMVFLRDRAIAAISQGVIIADAMAPDFPVVYANPTFAQLTGYSAEETIGRNCRFLQGGETDPEAVAQVRAALREGRSTTVEILNYRKDGSTFWNSLTVSPIRDDHGVVTHFVGTLTDVTEQRLLEQRFQQSQKMEAIGRLAGGVAHDFNNLLTAILGYTDLILATVEESNPIHEDLAQVRESAQRAAALTGQLLTFSRRQIVLPRTLNLNSSVRETEKLLRRMIGEDITLATRLEADPAAIRADPTQIGQVLLNLSVNARDAMPQGGRLDIETRAMTAAEAAEWIGAAAVGDQYVALIVSDTGAGMDEETLRHLFEPFFTTKPAGQGTGLGLATVYGILKQCGGDVHVESKPGRGSRFRLFFPILASDAGASDADGGRVEPGTGTETLLLVDDEAQVGQLAQRILSGYGYQLLAASSPEIALQLSRGYQGDIDLLVTDVVMPEMSGRQLAEIIQAERPGCRVLYLSGYTDDAVLRHGVQLTEEEFLPKPFTAVELASKVRRVLDAPARPGRA